MAKARGSPHEFDSREYMIAQGEIALLPFDETIAKALSLIALCSPAFCSLPTLGAKGPNCNDLCCFRDGRAVECARHDSLRNERPLLGSRAGNMLLPV